MKKLVFLFLVVFILVLGGCATFRGMGEDFHNLGRGLQEVFADD